VGNKRRSLNDTKVAIRRLTANTMLAADYQEILAYSRKKNVEEDILSLMPPPPDEELRALMEESGVLGNQ
jgi:hypothetical protein